MDAATLTAIRDACTNAGAAGSTAPLRAAAAAGDHRAVATLLNTPVAGAPAVGVGSAPTSALRACVGKADYVALNADGRGYLAFLLAGDALDISPTVITELGALFPAGSSTRARLVALLMRQPTLLETIATVGLRASIDDVDAALSVPPLASGRSSRARSASRRTSNA